MNIWRQCIRRYRRAYCCYWSRRETKNASNTQGLRGAAVPETRRLLRWWDFNIQNRRPSRTVPVKYGSKTATNSACNSGDCSVCPCELTSADRDLSWTTTLILHVQHFRVQDSECPRRSAHRFIAVARNHTYHSSHRCHNALTHIDK